MNRWLYEGMNIWSYEGLKRWYILGWIDNYMKGWIDDYIKGWIDVPWMTEWRSSMIGKLEIIILIVSGNFQTRLISALSEVLK